MKKQFEDYENTSLQLCKKRPGNTPHKHRTKTTTTTTTTKKQNKTTKKQANKQTNLK